MDNQHQKIKGYRDLSQKEIDLMNKIKTKGQELEALLGEVHDHLQKQTVDALNFEKSGNPAEVDRIDAAQPQRWTAMARTDFQTGLMALTRAIAQPTTF